MTNSTIQQKVIQVEGDQFDLDKLRQIDFTRFIQTPIRAVGGKRVTHCPFHKEKTPSFYIYPNNSYFCFGCNVHGNAVDFLVNKFGYSFEHTCSILEGL